MKPLWCVFERGVPAAHTLAPDPTKSKALWAEWRSTEANGWRTEEALGEVECVPAIIVVDPYFRAQR